MTNPAQTAPGDEPLFLEIRPPAAGFHVYLIRGAQFPVKPLHLSRWLSLYRLLRPPLFPAGTRPLPVIQMWRLHHNDGASVLSGNAQAWMPDFGAGVWLDAPPPRLWTPEDFMNLGPGELLPPPVLSAIRLRSPQLDHEQAWMQLGGRGCYMEFTVGGDPEAFLEKQAGLYRTWIEEPMIAAQTFFVPLIKAASFESALFASRQKHADPLLTYVRESAEDEGLLILSREKLEGRFEQCFKAVPWAAPDEKTQMFLIRPAALPA
jgi:hypothetical protein